MRPPGIVLEHHLHPIQAFFILPLFAFFNAGVALDAEAGILRNLNTGGNNYDETESVTAINTVHHSAEYPSQIMLSVRP